MWTAHAEAANLAAEGLKTYKENTDQAVIAQEVFAQFIEGTAAEVTKLDKSLKTMADGAVEAQAAQGELYETLRDGNLELGAWVTATDVAAERATAFAEALEDLNSASELTLSQRIIDLSDGIHGFGEALQEANEAGVEWSEIDFIPDTWEEVQDMPDDLRGVVESFAGMRDQIQGELAAAFETGGTSGLLTAVGTLRTAIINELKAAGITGAAELKAALEALGLDDQTIEILIEVSGQEQARQALAGIQGTIDSLVDAGLIGIQTSVDIAAGRGHRPEEGAGDGDRSVRAGRVDGAGRVGSVDPRRQGQSSTIHRRCPPPDLRRCRSQHRSGRRRPARVRRPVPQRHFHHRRRQLRRRENAVRVEDTEGRRPIRG